LAVFIFLIFFKLFDKGTLNGLVDGRAEGPDDGTAIGTTRREKLGTTEGIGAVHSG
jgi:hypothetical protein